MKSMEMNKMETVSAEDDIKSNLSPQTEWPYLKLKDIPHFPKAPQKHYLYHPIEDISKLLPATAPESYYARTAGYVCTINGVLHLHTEHVGNKNIYYVHIKVSSEIFLHTGMFIEVFGRIDFELNNNKLSPFVHVYFLRELKDSYSSYVELMKQYREIKNTKPESTNIDINQQLNPIQELISELKDFGDENVFLDLQEFICSQEKEVVQREQDFTFIKQKLFPKDIEKLISKGKDVKYIDEFSTKLLNAEKELEIQRHYLAKLQNKLVAAKDNTEELELLLTFEEENILEISDDKLLELSDDLFKI